MYAAGLSTGFVQLAQDLHVDFGKLSHLISWVVFALGVSNLFWMPTALCIGKRAVTLISMVTFLVGSVWSTKAKGYNSLLGARILATFGMFPFNLRTHRAEESSGAGSVEALGPSMIAGKSLRLAHL